MSPWVRRFENESLLVRPYLTIDREALFIAASDPLIWQQHPDPLRYTEAGFAKYLDKVLTTDSPLVVIDKTSGAIIGCTTYYEFDIDSNSICIGYTFLTRVHWGGNTNQVVKNWLIDHAFTLVDKVYFHIGANNTRSRTAIARFGAVLVRTDDHWADGVNYPHCLYLIEKVNWSETNT